MYQALGTEMQFFEKKSKMPRMNIIGKISTIVLIDFPKYAGLVRGVS